MEKDRKTFDYVKMYVEFLENNGSTCLVLDNQIQTEEIKDHLRRVGSDANLEGIKKREVTRWIKENARPFRDYLNSIKLIYVVWKCMGNEWKEITWEEFVKIQERLNKLKYNCLDTIF